jgi:hypothetical protein
MPFKPQTIGKPSATDRQPIGNRSANDRQPTGKHPLDTQE